MSSDEHKTLRQHALGELREIDDFRHIRQIVTGEGHDIGPPVLQEFAIITMAFDLQINEEDLMPCLSDRLGYEFQSKRLQSKIDFCIHQRTGMNRKYFH